MPPRSLRRWNRQGFTLIELLLVIGIIAILASIVIVAINPTRQLASSRNAQRHSDVNTIINATYQYAIDNNQIPSTITTVETPVCKYPHPASSDSVGCITMFGVTGAYIVSIPNDPQQASGTGYAGY